MVRKSNHSRADGRANSRATSRVTSATSARRGLLAGVGEAVQAFQDATDEVDEAAARILQINRTDLRCLGVLTRVRSLSAGELASVAGLTRGAMTTVLDRLEEAGFVRRLRDARDRRGVRVEITGHGQDKAEKLYGPIAVAGVKVLERYTTRELEAVLRFLEDGQRLQEQHAEWLRALVSDSTSRPRKAVRRGDRT